MDSDLFIYLLHFLFKINQKIIIIILIWPLKITVFALKRPKQVALIKV